MLPQWVFDEDEKAPQIHQQKIKVAYLPPEGQVLEEEDIGQASTMTEGEAVRPIPPFSEYGYSLPLGLSSASTLFVAFLIQYACPRALHPQSLRFPLTVILHRL